MCPTLSAVTKPPDRPLIRTRLDTADLGAAWEANAAAFIAWARKPGHDSYWQFHRDLFLGLVPPPGRRTLDLGCGEGRLSRDLSELGHHVVAVDRSPTMLAAARAADPGIETHLADAAALPFGDGEFDLVVAFMSLQDMDDYERAIREAGRVLVSGGRLCIAIVHPLNSAGRFEGNTAESSFVVSDSYLDPSYHADNVVRDGLEIDFVSGHRPLQAYCEAIADAGLVIERLREPALPEHAITRPHSRRWQRLPLFLHLRGLKQ
ncbi:MAG: class I SAM-dependent methyltransferase [Actinobacteria bacterium]|nr:class I SAM-dependent methyltransferase [Actinomycetota bacterium]